MHRSASWSRVAEDYYMHSTMKEATGLRMSMPMEGNELPAYDPIVEMAQKEKSRIKFAENAVHVIPFVLLLCGLILWLFSNPVVGVGNKGESVAAKIQGLTIEGDIDIDSDGTQTGFLPIEVGDLSNSKQAKYAKSFRKLASIF